MVDVGEKPDCSTRNRGRKRLPRPEAGEHRTRAAAVVSAAGFEAAEGQASADIGFTLTALRPKVESVRAKDGKIKITPAMIEAAANVLMRSLNSGEISVFTVAKEMLESAYEHAVEASTESPPSTSEGPQHRAHA